MFAQVASKKVEIADRRKKVAQYYLSKMQEAEIAAKVGVSQGTVSNDLKALKKQWIEEAQADISEHVARELAELDAMELDAAALYQFFKGSKEKGVPLNSKEANKWFETRLKIKDRRARMLGLDSPEKLNIDAKQSIVIHLVRKSCRREDSETLELCNDNK